MSSALDELAATPIDAVAERLGLEVFARGFAPCPACGADSRSAKERRRRPPAEIRRGGWRCYRCNAAGGAVKLVCLALLGEALERGDARWSEVLRWCDDGGPRASLAPRTPTTAPPPDYPPVSEVAGLWRQAGPIGDRGPVTDWCERRHLNVSRIRERDLLRVLPPSGLPRWARGPHGTWRESGHLALLPLYDAAANLRSFRARLVVTASEMKAYPPSGHRVTGLVMADPLLRALLAAHDPPPARVLIVEGEPDFLTWATWWQDRDPDRHAVCGVFSGAWSDAIAHAVPQGSRVVIRTHADPAGESYAARILQTLDLSVVNAIRAPAGGAHGR